MAPFPGEQITPHVRLIEPLAEGSMGTVWVADHLTLHTQVAVKLIAAERGAGDEELGLRFAREARAAARIKSQHVVRIFDYGISSSGTPYMVLELLEGESLAARLARDAVLSIEETATIVVHVARALSKAHELGIVHRDIKPANIFLMQGEEGLFCKVLDFGVAKELPAGGARPAGAELTLDGALVGTPEYMSPEQMLGGRVDRHADLWALAVVAHLCLTGRLPFIAKNIEALAKILFAGTRVPPSALRAGLSAELDDWFARAFQKKKEARFTSAEEMASEFRRVAPTASPGSIPPAPEAPPVSETLSGSTTRSWRPGRARRRWWRPIVATAALAVGAVLALWLPIRSAPVSPRGHVAAEPSQEPPRESPAAPSSAPSASVAVDAAQDVEQSRRSIEPARKAAPRASARSTAHETHPKALPSRELGF
jgi:serine/threonine-protein kinase